LNRFVLMMLVGFAGTVAILASLAALWWGDLTGNQSSVRLSFFASLAEDILFFGLVGLAIVLHQVYASRGDILRKRVEHLFANSAVSYPAIEYIENVVRKNGVYSQRTLHDLEILEYDPAHYAYRVSFHNTYHLRNLFGDIRYSADLAAVVAPDLIKDGVDPLGVVSSVTLTSGAERKQYLPAPMRLDPHGFKLPVSVSLSKNGEATYEMEWWSWASNLGNSGFSVRRFSEHTIVSVKNRSNVTARIARPEEPGKVLTLRYNEQVIVREQRNVPPNTRLDFSWMPPEEHATQPDPDPRGGGAHPILYSEDKV
jgi:hypothetical protein